MEMCGEIERGSNSVAALLAVVVFSLFSTPCVRAQVLPAAVQDLFEQMAEDGVQDGELLEYYENLALRRPDINSLSRQELERTHLLSIFQIESLLEHRLRYGDVLSSGELALVDGFSPAFAEQLKLFFSFSDTPLTTLRQRRGWSHEASARVRKPFGENGVAVTGKYRCASPRHWSFGLTADSDAGETLSKAGHPDFVSAFAAWKGSSVVKNVVAGDFTVRAGQGLVVWKSFSMNAVGAPSTVMKRPSGIKPYTSSGESGFFRGGAATFDASVCDISVFASYNAVDARILEDGSYSSVYDSGYHRTQSEREWRRSMHETAAGITASREWGNWRVGLSAIAYSYDRKNGRTVKEYNRYQQYDGWWGNFGADFFYFRGAFRLFGEIASDPGGGIAALLGTVWNPVYEFEFSATARHYGKNYIATHAGACSTLSSCSNQDGLTFAARWYVSKRWSLLANVEAVYYPWSRYGIQGPSYALKSRLSAIWKADERLSSELKLKLNGGTDGLSVLADARVAYAFNRHLSVSGRFAANTGGFAACIGFGLTLLRGKMEISGRFTGYSTDGYSSRIYFYEGNVPQTFSCRALYGKGTGGYVMLKYSPLKWLSLYLRVSDDSASYFMRSFIPG